MDKLIELEGLAPELYPWVGPLVMNAEVLKQNYNFPFRTAENFRWYLSVAGNGVNGFLPVEHRKKEWLINNYYVRDHNPVVLQDLLQCVVRAAVAEGRMLAAVVFLEDRDVFAEAGFEEVRRWTRYVRMVKNSL